MPNAITLGVRIATCIFRENTSIPTTAYTNYRISAKRGLPQIRSSAPRWDTQSLRCYFVTCTCTTLGKFLPLCYLRFLMCKMGLMLAPNPMSCENTWDNSGRCSICSKCSINVSWCCYYRRYPQSSIPSTSLTTINCVDAEKVTCQPDDILEWWRAYSKALGDISNSVGVSKE